MMPESLSRIAIASLLWTWTAWAGAQDLASLESELDEPGSRAELEVIESAADRVEQWSLADQGRYHYLRAMALERAGQLDAAFAAHTRSLELLQRLPAPTPQQVHTLLDRSYIGYLQTNDPEVYCPDRLEAIEVGRQAGDPQALAKALYQTAFCFRDSKDFSRGVALLGEAIDLADTHQFAPNAQAMIYNAASVLYRNNRLHQRAYDYALRAYQAWAEADDRQDMFNMQHILVGESIAQGLLDSASDHVERLFELAETSPQFPDFVFFAHFNAGRLAASRNDHDEAVSQFQTALDHRDSTEEAYFVRAAEGFLAESLYRIGRHAEASTHAAAFLEGFPPNDPAEVRDLIARAIRQAGDQPFVALATMLEALDLERRRGRDFVHEAAAATAALFDQQAERFRSQVAEQQLQIKDLELATERERRRAATQLNALIAVIALILVLALLGVLRSRRTFQHRARTDSLTEIANRAWGMSEGERQLQQCRSRGQPLSVMIIDVDHFKSINDRHGHHAGDRAIIQVAQRCVEVLGSEHLVARIGGEEFLAVLPGSDQDNAMSQAERLRRAVESDAVESREGPIDLTLSIGVATTAGQDDRTLEQVIRSADRALYAAKDAGRNRVSAARSPIAEPAS